MLPHQLSCPIGGLLLSVLMLKDANPNHYAAPGVDCVVSHESRQFTDDRHKVLLGHLRHPLRVGNTLVSAHCNVHSFTPPPKRRRGRRVPPNQLINVPSVKGYKGWRNFRESPKGEVRRIPIPRIPVNRASCLLWDKWSFFWVAYCWGERRCVQMSEQPHKKKISELPGKSSSEQQRK